MPLAWDGRLLVTSFNGEDLSDSFLWAWTPWLQHYVAAFGMAVGGDTSFGARWPFALLGCLSFPFFFLLVRGMTKSRFIAVAAAVMLLTSVQYLLLMRQCRYYALLPVLFFLCVYGYRLLPARSGCALFSTGLVLFFYSNYVSCAMLMRLLENSGVRVEKVFHLDINDVRWINRPLLSKHLFRMPEAVSPDSGVDILLLGRG